MKIKDITIEDIKDGKSWKIIDYNTGDIEVTTNIRNNDYTFHSAVAITSSGDIFPGIIAKSYEDGGEIGELYIYYQNKWQQLNKKFRFLNIEDYYFPNPQEFDFHLSNEEKQENITKFKKYIEKI